MINIALRDIRILIYSILGRISKLGYESKADLKVVIVLKII